MTTPGRGARKRTCSSGGGMAGLTAAARATARGLSVTVVERAPALGGSTLHAGYLWTAPTAAAMSA